MNDNKNNDNKMVGASIDIETTGLQSGLHEIVELSVILHDENFKPVETFTSKIKPMRPEIVEPEALIINNLSLSDLKDCATPAQVRNAFFDWHENIIGNKKIIPLGHNYGSFDSQFLRYFFGHFYDEIFHYKCRDTHALAQGLKDCGLLELTQSLSLKNLCEKFAIPHKAHSSYGDAMGALILYRALVKLIMKH